MASKIPRPVGGPPTGPGPEMLGDERTD